MQWVTIRAVSLRRNPENAEKGLQTILFESWLLHGVIGLQENLLFPSWLHMIHIYCQFKFDRQMSHGCNYQVTFLRFAAVHGHGCRHVAVYSSWPHAQDPMASNRPSIVFFQPLSDYAGDTLAQNMDLNTVYFTHWLQLSVKKEIVPIP